MELTLQEIQAIETEMIKEVHRICEENQIVYFLGYGSVLGAVRHHGPIPWDSDMDIVVPVNQFDKLLEKLRENLPTKFYVDYYDDNPKYQSLFPRIGLKGYSSLTLHIDIFKLIGTSKIPKEQLKQKRKLGIYFRIHILEKRKIMEKRNSFLQKIELLVGKLCLIFMPPNYVRKKFEELCNKYSYANSEFLINASEGYRGKGILKKKIYGSGSVVDYEDFQVRIPSQYDEYLKHFYGNYMELPNEKERRIKKNYTINEK